ncbi:MAG: type II toxin-antitoxin system YafQ family toxin [Synergistaceae bacterium]|nr:type II toxin-antitoxin system YafQ family toxin [Synergistaceae bacterium]
MKREFIYRAPYKRDYKRVYRGIYRKLLEEGGVLDAVIKALANNISLPLSYHDHSLHGNWEGCRECHIRPDLLLVYRYVNDDLLILERLGTHSEIFGL